MAHFDQLRQTYALFGDIWFSKPVRYDIWYIICQTDGFAGKLVCLCEPPGILHWSSFEYWCQWTIWQVVALVDNDMPLSSFLFLLVYHISHFLFLLIYHICPYRCLQYLYRWKCDNFRKMMFIVSNSVPMLCSTILFFAPNFPTLIGIEFFCSSQPSMVHWLSSSIFRCRLFVRRPAMVTFVQISLLVAPHPQTHTFSESLW